MTTRNSASRRWQSGSGSPPNARRAHEASATALEIAQTDVGLAIDELRELAHGIHPAALTDLGLASAIKGLARRSTVPITLVELPATRFDDAAEATAYYVFAEALTNAQKHAHPSSIRVRATPARRTLDLEIVDDGAGGATGRTGGGLTGLRDRVEALGGTFTVDSPSGHGTRIAAAIPAAPALPERRSRAAADGQSTFNVRPSSSLSSASGSRHARISA
jgi:signal transduction histidine kinase